METWKHEIIVVVRLQYYRARLRRHFGHLSVVTPTLGIASLRRLTRRDVVSCRRCCVWCHFCVWMLCRPRQTSRKGILPIYLVRRRHDRTPTPTPPSSFPTSRWAFGRSVLHSFYDRPALQLNAQRLFTARSADWCACSKLNTLKRFDYNFLYVRFGVWTKTEVFEPRLAVVFIDLFLTIRFFFFSLFDITQPQKWACSVQPPPNSWKSIR